MKTNNSESLEFFGLIARAFAALLLLIVAGPLSAQEKSGELERYISVGLRNSAQIEAAFNRWQAEVEQRRQVGALPDPKFSYGYFIQEVETRVGPQQHKLSISQAFPWFGTLSLKEEQAGDTARAEFYRFVETKNQLVYEITNVYVELLYLCEAKETSGEMLQLLRSWEGVILERFRSGSENHSNVVSVQLELGRLQEKIFELGDAIRPVKEKLRALTGMDAGESVDAPSGMLSKGELSVAVKDPSKLDLSRNPELLMFEAMSAANEVKVKLAKKSFYPGFNVGLDYIPTGDRAGVTGGGKDGLIALVSLNIPLDRGKYNARLEQSRREKKSSEAFLEDRRRLLKADLEAARSRLRDSNRKIKLYRSALIPKAQESVQAGFAEYRSGEIEFRDLIAYEQQFLELRLGLSRAAADRAIAQAMLLRLSGGSVSFESEQEEVL